MTAPLIGTTLGKYEIVEELGHGGMSVVYRGLDTQLRRDVAVKVMHSFLAEQEEARERFHREAVAVARLRHPHIIEIFDYSGEEAETSYIVTELIDGRPLSELIKAKPPKPPELAFIIGRPIIDALSHAHEHGVIHRDLKPENILVGRDGTLKLTDFGIARMLDSQTLTMTGTLLGSPAYMAPEYIEGYSTDARADIFSFGAMLYQLAVGSLPFEGTTPHALLRRIATGEYVGPDQANPLVHARLARLIRRCLARLPEKRFSTAIEVRNQIDESLDRIEIDAAEALPAVLTDPTAFGEELQTRLGPCYLDLGKAALETGSTGVALEDFDRVLSLDPDNTEVRSILDRIARRRWAARSIAIGCIGLFGAVLLTLAVSSGATWLSDRRARAAATAAALAALNERPEPTIRKANVTFSLNGTGALYIDGELIGKNAEGLRAYELSAGDHEARFIGAKKKDEKRFVVPQEGPVDPVLLDVHVSPVPKQPLPPKIKVVTFKPAGMWVTAYVDGNSKPFVVQTMKSFTIPLSYGEHRILFTNARAQPSEIEVTVDRHGPPGPILVHLEPLPARLKVIGLPDRTIVEVAGKQMVISEHNRGVPILIPLKLAPGQGSRELHVVVRAPDGNEVRRSILFRPGEEQTLEFSL